MAGVTLIFGGTCSSFGRYSMANDNATIQRSSSGRVLVLITTFLGWMMAEIIMAIAPLVGRAVTASLPGTSDERVIGRWLSTVPRQEAFVSAGLETALGELKQCRPAYSAIRFLPAAFTQNRI